MKAPIVLIWTLFAAVLIAQEPSGQSETNDAPEATDQAVEVPEFVLTDDVRDALVPLFASIANADVTRATVQMLSDSLVRGRVIESTQADFQIASARPDQYTIYWKQPDRRARVFCDGKQMLIAVTPDAYIRIPQPLSSQDAVTGMPIAMGPYVEPLLALTLAGVDPAITFLAGMKSIVIADRDQFRGRVPAIHLRGEQADHVTWDLWITDSETPKPIRLLIDLTPMLQATEGMKLPDGFSYQVRYDFLSWRATGTIDRSLFTFKPPSEAKEYSSLQDYYQSTAQAMEAHPLLGKAAPSFKVDAVDGRPIDSDDLRGKIVVLDFWATWCAPCVTAIPIMHEIVSQYRDKDVVFVALNTGEDRNTVDEFVSAQSLPIRSGLDPDGSIADRFHIDALPQTLLIGKDGTIESVHVGYPDEPSLRKRLSEELDILTSGGRIASGHDPEP